MSISANRAQRSQLIISGHTAIKVKTGAKIKPLSGQIYLARDLHKQTGS
jgi:hypothetical protein